MCAMYYSDDKPYIEATFQIPAEKWAEFRASQQYKDMDAYAKEMQEEWGKQCCDNEKARRIAETNVEGRKYMERRINKARSIAICALVIAIAAAAVALLH